nr:MAG TPA: hypothetical protein [Caudoviricetes sp.]
MPFCCKGTKIPITIILYIAFFSRQKGAKTSKTRMSFTKS